ncbi:MAG: queuosine salvage family protein [Candidatus Ranarchaeia archaeon]
MKSARVNINFDQCRSLAHTLDNINLSTQLLSPISVNLKELPTLIRDDFLFILIAICHDTKSLSGIIQGNKIRGWDYLLQKMFNHAVDHPEDFSEKKLQQWTSKKLQEILSDNRRAQTSTIKHPEGRVELLHDLGIQLGQIGGHIRDLYQKSKGQIEGKTGLYTLFQQFKAYKDPLLKKSTVFLKFASQELGWKINDPENLVMPIDYHNQRIALRYGLLDLPPSLEEVLKEQKPIDESTHTEIRSACQIAYDHVIKQSQSSLFAIDTFLWNLGRHCCPHDSNPHCNKCTTIRCELTSILGEVDITKCVLAKRCKGSADQKFRDLKECNIVTEFY